jgi:hypothetical protein
MSTPFQSVRRILGIPEGTASSDEVQPFFEAAARLHVRVVTHARMSAPAGPPQVHQEGALVSIEELLASVDRGAKGALPRREVACAGADQIRPASSRSII